MVFKDKDNNRYIGPKKNIGVLSIQSKKIEEVEELELCKKTSDSLNSFSIYNERLLRALYILNNSKNKVPLIYGRILNHQKDMLPTIRKEFLVYNMESLARSIGKLRGEVLIEFIVFDTSIDIKLLFDFCRENKSKFIVFHFDDIEDNAVFNSAKNIHKLYIPKYIHNILEEN